MNADLFSFIQRSFLLSFCQVFENATVGSPVGQCRVDDEDKGQSYAYSLQNDDNGLFSITSSGQVKIAKKVDFELQRAHKITIVVQNGNQNVSGEFPSKFLVRVRMCCLLVFGLVFYDFLEFKAVSKFVKSWVVGKRSTIFYTADTHMVTDFRLVLSLHCSSERFYSM